MNGVRRIGFHPSDGGNRTLPPAVERRGMGDPTTVKLSPRAVNPKVPVAALGAVELGQLVYWLFNDIVPIAMPTHISAILGGILAWVIASYLIPHRVD